MDEKILDLTNQIEKSRKKRRIWKKIVTSLATVVVFCTTYMLILPAITMEKETICGKEEHVHGEECYVKITTVQELQLDCTYDSSNVHEHTDECYEVTEETVTSDPVLVCGKEETEPHEHTEECMKTVDVPAADMADLTCGQEESEEHTHTERCYGTWTQTCELEEHTHTEICLPVEESEIIQEPQKEESVSNEEAELPDTIDAWAETTNESASGKEKSVMKSFSLRNNAGISTYAEDSNEPLDMTEWITNVTMLKHENGTVTEIGNGTTVYEGDLIQFKLEYTIEGQVLGKMQDGQTIETLKNTVMYQIPDSFQTVDNSHGNIYNSDDEIVGTFNIDSATNTITLVYSDEFVEENAYGKQINGYISFYSVVEKVTQDTQENQNHVFNSKVEVTLDVQESQKLKGDLAVEKAKTSVNGNEIRYMISVSSAEGTNENVTLSDVMSPGLSYKAGTLTVTKKGSPVNYSITTENNSLDLVLPAMAAGDTYIITYDAEADIDLLDADMSVENTVTVNSKDSHNNQLTDSTTVTHNFNILDKKGEPGEAGEIEWTITINQAKLDISGWTLTDVLNGVVFNGPVDIYNSSNELINQNEMLPYTFPNGSNDTYYIKYTTEHSLIEGKNVTNEARFEKDGTTVKDEFGTSIGTPIEKMGMIAGEVQKNEDGEYWVPITWTVTIDTSAGPIPSGNYFFDSLDSVSGSQQSYMTGDQVIAAYDAISEALQEALNYQGQVLSGGEATVFGGTKSYNISQLSNNQKYRSFKFTLAKDIPQGKKITFSYQSTGIFYSNTVVNSTYVNHFNISNSYEVTAKVNFSVGNIQAFKRAYKYYDPNGTPDGWYWDYIGSESAEFEFEKLKDKYLAWGIEVDIPAGYSGSGDVIIYENLPDGVTIRGIETKEISGESAYLGNIELGNEYVLSGGISGSYTVKVTNNGDLEITIPEEAIEYRCSQFQYMPDWNEWWTFFYIYVQINDNLDWPHINENSMISKKEFENNFTVTNSDGDTIAFGKQTQVITRDDSKGHVLKSASSDQNYVNYQVILNPEGRDFDPDSDTLNVKDILEYKFTDAKPLKLTLVARSVALYEYDGKDTSGNVDRGDPVEFSYVYNETVGVEAASGAPIRTHTIDLIVPDGQPLILEYRYRADGANETHSLVNTCTIEGVGQGNIDGTSEFEAVITNASAGANTRGVTIYKVDEDNFGVYLKGAKFKLSIWNKEENEYIQMSDIDGNNEFVTDKDGKIVLDKKYIQMPDSVDNNEVVIDSDGENVLDETIEYGEYIAYNTAYELTEIQAPDGYYLQEEPYYFYIVNNDLVKYPECKPANFAGKALQENDNIFFTNENNSTNLVIYKKWKDYNGNEITVKGNQVSEVKFELWQKVDGVANSDKLYDTYTITPDENGNWEMKITRLPKGKVTPEGKKDGDQLYRYYIKEVSVPNYEIESYVYDDGNPSTTDTQNGINSGIITMTNREAEGYELPETGGIGTKPYTMGGLLLTTVATLFFLLYKDKKHGKEDITSS